MFSFMIGIEKKLNHFLIGDIMGNTTYVMCKKDKDLFSFWQMDCHGELSIVFIPDLKHYIIIKIKLFTLGMI